MTTFLPLCGWENLSQSDEQTFAATCFMSHEVAFKAGMHAKCGTNNDTLKYHSLLSPPHALMQVGHLEGTTGSQLMIINILMLM